MADLTQHQLHSMCNLVRVGLHNALPHTLQYMVGIWTFPDLFLGVAQLCCSYATPCSCADPLRKWARRMLSFIIYDVRKSALPSSMTEKSMKTMGSARPTLWLPFCFSLVNVGCPLTKFTVDNLGRTSRPLLTRARRLHSS